MNNSEEPLPCMQREGQVEGHLLRSVADVAPIADKHPHTHTWALERLAAAPLPHNIYQQMKDKIKGRQEVERAVLNQLERSSSKRNRRVGKQWRRVHALGSAQYGERRKGVQSFSFS